VNSFFFVLSLIFLALTLGILFAGLFGMSSGGEFNKKYGNMLMRARIYAHAATIGSFILYLITR
jgi:hypothetical protein